MQTTDQTEPPLTREAIETAIEDQKEAIRETRYALRWLIRICWAIPLSIAAISIASFIGWFFPVVNALVFRVDVGAGLIGVVCLASLFPLFTDYGKETSGNLRELREEKNELAKLRRGLAYFDEQALRHLTPEQYMHQVPRLIASYRRRADGYRNWFVALQIVTILLSAAITSLSGGWLDRYISLPWIIPVLSAIISVLTSFTLFFKFREKGVNLQETANRMDWEHMACTLGIGQYEGKSREDARRLLAKTCELLRQEQQKRQVQLEQSSHAEQKALQAST